MQCFKLRSLILTLLFVITWVVASAFPNLWDKGIWELPVQAVETISETTSIPTIAYTNGEQQVQAPDWSKITFSSLPPIEEPGWIQIPQKLINKMGYDPSRIWTAGATADQILMLGDTQDAFHLEAFNLKDIFGLTGLATKTLNLSDFGLTQWQTPKSLVKAIPGLGNLPVAQIAPLRDLMKVGGGWSGGSIAQAIRQNPTFARLPLGELDLKKYSLRSIPGLSETALGKFAGWQQSFITQVPGLSSVSFSQFPVPLLGQGISLGIMDVPWSAAEHGDPKLPASQYISGTINRKDKTVPVPCKAGQPCAYIELSDPLGTNGTLHGKRWVSGKTQKVKGGFGILAKVNNGWEPTGKLVFGSAFKVVLTDTNESKGTAGFALYFRACVHIPFYGRSCTPYFIGGIPWFPSNEKGLVIVASTDRPNVNIPTKYKEQIDQIAQENSAQPTPLDSNGSQSSPDTIASPGGGTTLPGGQGDIPSRIATAAENSYGMDTSTAPGTQGGKVACAWAINRVLNRAGIKTLGGNCSLAVDCVERDLQSGRGQLITERSQAKPGDIALIPGAHIGICENNGCTRILSNSSSKRAFVWHSDQYMSPSYGSLTKIYRVTN